MSSNDDTGWSPVKTAIVWAGAVLVAIILATVIAYGIRVSTQSGTAKYKACFEQGFTPAECAVALQ